MNLRIFRLLIALFIVGACNTLDSTHSSGKYITRQDNYVISLSVPDDISHSKHSPRWDSWCLTNFKDASYTFQCLDGGAKQDDPSSYTAYFANWYGKRIVMVLTFGDDYKTAEGIIQEQNLDIPFDRMTFVDDDTVLDVNGDGILDEVQDL